MMTSLMTSLLASLMAALMTSRIALPSRFLHTPPFPLPSHTFLPASFTPLPCRRRHPHPRPARLLQSVHLLHRAAVSAKGSPAPRLDLPDEVAMQTHQAATVVFPDRCDADCVCLRSDCV